MNEALFMPLVFKTTKVRGTRLQSVRELVETKLSSMRWTRAAKNPPQVRRLRRVSAEPLEMRLNHTLSAPACALQTGLSFRCGAAWASTGAVEKLR